MIKHIKHIVIEKGMSAFEISEEFRKALFEWGINVEANQRGDDLVVALGKSLDEDKAVEEDKTCGNCWWGNAPGTNPDVSKCRGCGEGVDNWKLIPEK